jgi:dihydroorotate dehydrogenase (NAD+) catalytic subunit
VAGVRRSIAVDLGGWALPTPVMVASGCAGTGKELSGYVDTHRVGAIVTRSITIAPRRGDPTPRIAESPSGVIWATGMQNPGIEGFVEEELPRFHRMGAPVVVSIVGGTLEEYVRLTTVLQRRPEVAAIEVRLSEPDDEMDRALLGAHPDRAVEIVGAVARMSLVPVFAKLPAVTTDLVELARGAVRAGAHGLTLVDAPPALGVDADTLRPRLGPVRGWLAGPALKPLTLRAVYEVAQALPEVPIVAVGGVRSGTDAVEMLLAGAWAVQVGTATLIDPAAPVEVARGIAAYLKEKRIASPMDLRGRLRVPRAFDPRAELA